MRRCELFALSCSFGRCKECSLVILWLECKLFPSCVCDTIEEKELRGVFVESSVSTATLFVKRTAMYSEGIEVWVGAWVCVGGIA